MSKLTKLVRHPYAFFRDAVRNRIRHAYGKPASAIARRQHLDDLIDIEGAIQAVHRLKPSTTYVYLPWIQSHGDVLFEAVNRECGLLECLPVFREIHKRNRRRAVSQLARAQPHVLRRLFVRLFSSLPEHVVGVAFSLDWNAPMRQAAYAAKEIGLRTILIPHEAIFADPGLYYVDVSNGADYPICDHVCAWGELQATIFRQRGYPPERISLTGAPKFDRYLHYAPELSRDVFCRVYRFDPELPIVLFALQPLDSQFNPRLARAAQQQAIESLLVFCQESKHQLLVRCPPSDDEVLGDVRQPLEESLLSQIDEARPYLTPPEESIHHAAAVVSVNSTMLFEAALLGRPAISAKFLEFESLWQDCGGPTANTPASLQQALGKLLRRELPTLDVSSGSRAAQYFSPGGFEGGAASRIASILRMLPRDGAAPYALDDYSHLFQERASKTTSPGTLGYHRSLPPSMEHLPTLLGFRSVTVPKTLREASRVDVFARWGGGLSESHQRIDRFARSFGAPRIIVEDGFIRSVQIGLSGTPGLSIMIDDVAPYYDATQPTHLEQFLNSEWELTEDQVSRCQRLMSVLMEHRISKYNHAPDEPVKGAAAGSVLVIDQRVGDRSVVQGLASDTAFQDQLIAAIKEHPDKQVLVKRHPDAVGGDQGSYYSDDLLGPLKRNPAVRLIDYDVNPHALFDVCTDAYVVSSGMGFEALLRGLRVHCFGVPFYAGWGITQDRVSCDRRSRSRSVEEVFYASYLVHSRYVHPVRGELCDLEELVPALAKLRDGASSNAQPGLGRRFDRVLRGRGFAKRTISDKS